MSIVLRTDMMENDRPLLQVDKICYHYKCTTNTYTMMFYLRYKIIHVRCHSPEICGPIVSDAVDMSRVVDI
jgi:hypothetical protein